VQFLAGEVSRGCANLRVSTSQYKEVEGQQVDPAGRQVLEMFASFCNDADLCNGSGRLAEISTMKILLPASLVLFIYFFSRL
jgi:hypothetical protein